MLAEDSREMHKSWGNAIEFNEAADKMGADTMRWLFAGAKPEQNLLFGFNRGDETRRQFLIPLWNVYAFLISYANLDGWTPASDADGAAVSPNAAHAQLDRWIRERLDETVLATRSALDVYDAERATQHMGAFLDDLSNWYVRRSRRRFWKSEHDQDKTAAYATLYAVLLDFVKLLAPFVPFVTEAMYQNLAGTEDGKPSPRSVHHCLYPQASAANLDQRLLEKMRLAINTASLGRAARGAADVKLRQPLARARVNVGSQQERDDLMELADVLKEEINVKELEVVSAVGELVNYRLMPNNRVLGPRLGKLFPRLRQALSEVDPAAAARTLQSGEALTVSVDGQEVTLSGDDVLVLTESRGGLAVASDKGITVAVDIELTPALVLEGYARDLVRAVNNLRKEAGLEISDRIELYVDSDDADIVAATQNFAEFIQGETLATTLATTAPLSPEITAEVALGDAMVRLSLCKA
jgi:isoleucyl-tRNA synthetase